ncbi:hypothetical protein CH63R_08770 [Colletotrichum higginsianum IMI 349063]|uniref:Uncharacterized protein n=1 Tax=Colletotrichum higginsianum (strain IMI 349063) TaxID=759273 RepID=A0A1B7Y5B9_COLHI|nr:hypothetical protein CH63R_08770 [Colletotrichum higginsianum IMI 349063]OBR07249.1 hypothetical protein CH63R_08770 [Colletotrichum higginsianum IMI 349063]
MPTEAATPAIWGKAAVAGEHHAKFLRAGRFAPIVAAASKPKYTRARVKNAMFSELELELQLDDHSGAERYADHVV